VIWRRLSIGLFFLVSLSVLQCSRNSQPPSGPETAIKTTTPSVVLTTRRGESLNVQVEIADTPELRGRGLMFRKELPEGAGMLFLFPVETHNAFWMKNTLIPLDMIFAKQGKIVSIIQNTVPRDEKLLQPDAAYTMTLEVPGGYVSRHGLHVGDRFEWKEN
jgi:uncharacterized membrane protein (UPF0127 family)